MEWTLQWNNGGFMSEDSISVARMGVDAMLNTAEEFQNMSKSMHDEGIRSSKALEDLEGVFEDIIETKEGDIKELLEQVASFEDQIGDLNLEIDDLRVIANQTLAIEEVNRALIHARRFIFGGGFVVGVAVVIGLLSIFGSW